MLDPPLQHALYHTNQDFRQRHYVYTCCGLVWETDDPPSFDEQPNTNCLLCWRALVRMSLNVVRVVRG